MHRMSQIFLILFSALHSFNGHTGAYLRALHGHDLYVCICEVGAWRPM